VNLPDPEQNITLTADSSFNIPFLGQQCLSKTPLGGTVELARWPKHWPDPAHFLTTLASRRPTTQAVLSLVRPYTDATIEAVPCAHAHTHALDRRSTARIDTRHFITESPNTLFTMQRALSSTASAGAWPSVDCAASAQRAVPRQSPAGTSGHATARLEEWFSHLGIRASDAVGAPAHVAVAAHHDADAAFAAFDDDAGEYDDAYDDQYDDDCVLAGGGVASRCNRGGAGGGRSNRKRIDGKTSVYSSKHVRRQVAIRTR
jgi:hypothetical protein